jgi:hypothetical protein
MKGGDCMSGANIPKWFKVQIKRWERKKVFILRCGKRFDKVKDVGYETVRRRLETYK